MRTISWLLPIAPFLNPCFLLLRAHPASSAQLLNELIVKLTLLAQRHQMKEPSHSVRVCAKYYYQLADIRLSNITGRPRLSLSMEFWKGFTQYFSGFARQTITVDIMRSLKNIPRWALWTLIAIHQHHMSISKINSLLLRIRLLLVYGPARPRLPLETHKRRSRYTYLQWRVRFRRLHLTGSSCKCWPYPVQCFPKQRWWGKGCSTRLHLILVFEKHGNCAHSFYRMLLALRVSGATGHGFSIRRTARNNNAESLG